MSCTHTVTVPGHWVNNPFFDVNENQPNDYSDWYEGYEQETIKDVDVHRYKCTECDKIFYYSEAARQYYEEGITCSVKGLEG